MKINHAKKVRIINIKIFILNFKIDSYAQSTFLSRKIIILFSINKTYIIIIITETSKCKKKHLVPKPIYNKYLRDFLLQSDELLY